MEANPFEPPRSNLPPIRRKLSVWQQIGVYLLATVLVGVIYILMVGFHKLLWWMGSFVLPLPKHDL